MRTSVFRCSCLQASVVLFHCMHGVVQHLPLCLHRVSATPRHSHVQPAGHAGPDYAKTATMHNAQALDKYVGSVSAGAAVCTGFVQNLLPGYTWTRPQPTTMYRVLNKFASSWRAVATIWTSVLLLPAQGLMLHAQGWRSTCSACTGVCATSV
jgi:hypothetical protein